MLDIHERRILPYVKQDLQEKMVFIAGPRQCGKTTLAKHLLQQLSGRYYNWDVDAQRKDIRYSKLDEAAKLWVFDELHKYRRWRNWLKGQFDLHHPDHSFLVTGSARLDWYRRGGDSLQGRYFLYRLHPFTFSELLKEKTLTNLDELLEMSKDIAKESIQSLKDLLTLGGFPEPDSL